MFSGKNLFVQLTATFALSLVALLGCSSEEPRSTEVGVILPLTGAMAAGGNRVLQGIQVEVNHYNDTASQKISLKVEDSQGDPKVGVTALNHILNATRAKVVIGDLLSGVTLSMAPIAEQEQIVIVAPGASSPSIRHAGDYIFRIWTSDDYDGKVSAHYMFREMGLKSAAVLYIQNDYGIGLKSAFAEEYSNLGGKITDMESFQEGETQFRSIVAKLTQKVPEGIYIAGQPQELGFLIRQMSEAGVSTKVFSNASIEDAGFRTTVGGVNATITYTTPMFNLDDTSKVVREFVSDYTSEVGEAPDVASAHGYDAARVVLKCLNSKGNSGGRIRDCLYAIRDFPGVTGTFSIDQDGDVVKGLIVKRLDCASGRAEVLSTYNP